ncbi:MAG: bifunctional 5,10-methylenetetrahydrofolate dehydrogenase/5,10-methenyltetrahydrofolate cyclohydrolase [Candidatus Gracilibacteria bacterium]
MAIMDGKKISKEILQSLEGEVSALNKKHIYPQIAVILVGKDPASLLYVRKKQAACSEIGILWQQFDFDEKEVTTEKLIEKITELNEDEKVHGILVQVPLPKHVNTPLVMRAINPKNDVDGFTAYNLGKMFLSSDFEHLVPCTPLGVMRMLEHHKINVEGKEVVIVGHSNIVGKPLAVMFMNRNATVTVCHKFTKNLAEHTKRADILCVGVGKINLITADMVKDGAIVIDIGINHTKDGKICGDVDFDGVSKKASLITPVPGGVGPMTVACLMENTVTAAKRLNNLT